MNLVHVCAVFFIINMHFFASGRENIFVDIFIWDSSYFLDSLVFENIAKCINGLRIEFLLLLSVFF